MGGATASYAHQGLLVLVSERVLEVELMRRVALQLCIVRFSSPLSSLALLASS
jgi:hypothetical protein